MSSHSTISKADTQQSGEADSVFSLRKELLKSQLDNAMARHFFVASTLGSKLAVDSNASPGSKADSAPIPKSEPPSTLDTETKMLPSLMASLWSKVQPELHSALTMKAKDLGEAVQLFDEQWPSETDKPLSGSQSGVTSPFVLARTHSIETFNQAIDGAKAGSLEDDLRAATKKVKADSERFGEYGAYRRAASDRQVTISTFEEMLTDDRSLQAEAIAAFKRKFGSDEATKFTFQVEQIAGPGEGYKVISIGTANFPVAAIESEDDAGSKDHDL